MPLINVRRVAIFMVAVLVLLRILELVFNIEIDPMRLVTALVVGLALFFAIGLAIYLANQYKTRGSKTQSKKSKKQPASMRRRDDLF